MTNSHIVLSAFYATEYLYECFDVLFNTTSIRLVMRRFIIGEFVRGSFFRVFFLELQLRANRGVRNLCNINLSWQRRRE